jgi:hypothetical protein
VEWVRVGHAAAAAGEPPDGPRDEWEEWTVTQYLIAFNDEWVPTHTMEELVEKARAGRAVIAEMEAARVFVFSNGALDASTVVCSVQAREGKPFFIDGPYTETKEHLGGFTVVEVPDDAAARYWGGSARRRARLAARGAPLSRTS